MREGERWTGAKGRSRKDWGLGKADHCRWESGSSLEAGPWAAEREAMGNPAP